MSGAVDNSKFVAPIHISEAYDCVNDVADQIIFSDPQGHVIRLKDVGACRAGIFRAGFLHYEQRNEMFGPLYGDARGEQHRSNG